MWEWTKRYLGPPVFSDDEEASHQAAIMHIAALVMVVIYTLILLIPVTAGERGRAAELTVPDIVVGALSLLWVRRRFLRTAGMSMVACVWALDVAAALTAGGTKDPAFSALIVPVFLAALFFGAAGGLSVGLLVGASAAAIAVAEARGALPPSTIEHTPYTVLATHLFAWTAVTVLLHLIVRGVIATEKRSQIRLQERLAAEKAARESEQARRESEHQYRTLVENLNVGVYRTTGERQGRLLSANPAIARMFGYDSVEEFLEVPPSELYLRPQDRLRFIEQVQREGSAKDVELRLRRRDGTPFWGAVSAQVKYDEDGGIRWLDGIMEDRTERKQREEERRRLEAQLRRTQRLESLGVLAGGIAHDFNNILAAMVGFTEMTAAKLEPGSRARANLDQVLAAGERAKNLVRQILTFSRQTEHDMQPARLEPILDEALRLLRSSLPPAIEIRQEITPGCESVVADATQVHQVVMNLCTNAHQAMAETGGVLQVGLAPIDVDSATAEHLGVPPGAYARITVADTGSGMAEEVKDRIFDPFFTTKPPGEGTGLGLATAHGIVEGHSGAITVDSEPGAGTTFHVYLPFAGAHESAEAGNGVALPTGDERILLVDDEASIAALSEQMLTSIGYAVVAKTSSTEALETFRDQPEAFDLIVTDQMMPLLTGTQLIAAVREGRPDVPAVLVTGFGQHAGVQRAEAAGVAEVLMKPYSLRELAEVVRRALDA